MTRSFALILVVLPLQEQFSYDVNQNLREHRCLPRGAQAVLAQASQQQQAGRVVKRGDSQYRYDAAGRLVEKRSQKTATGHSCGATAGMSRTSYPN